VWAAPKEAAPKTKPEPLLSVAISQIALMTLHAHVTAYGVVAPATSSPDQPLHAAKIAFASPTRIAALLVQEGANVKKGDELLRLETLASAPSNFDKVLSLSSPLDGVVARITARVGDMIKAEDAVIELVDPTQLEVTASVPPEETANLKVGAPVEISTNLANSNVVGSLLSVSPVVDEKTGGVKVRAAVPAKAGVRPGQWVKLRIAAEEHANVLAVPVESLVKDPDVGYVVATIEGDVAKQHPVRVGIRDGDFVEVEGEGMKVGATVAAEGAYALPREARVHVITPTD